VDDDAGMLRLIEKSLKREGFTTKTATAGHSAIARIKEQTPDLLLLDLKLQDIEGKELIKHLASIGRQVPFIIITGQGDERVAVEMMKRGALDYLVKDVQLIEFVPTVVRRALEKLELDDRLKKAHAALAESQKQLMMVSEREQRRLGAELHDGLGQQLTGIELRCESLKHDLPPGRKDLKKQVSEISAYLREAIAQARLLARGLSPLNLDSRGLAEALEELALRMTRSGRVQCRFESKGEVVFEDLMAAGHLFRIAQEAVNNAVKHAQAEVIRIRLEKTIDALELEISDNGKGFSRKAGSDKGIGLEIMKHRASVIGAEFKISSKPGHGVSVTCRLQNKTA
jgi:signal transduction histidine kinase